MLQMSSKRILADGYGVGVIGIARRYVADIHLGPLRQCGRQVETRNSDTTVNEKKCLSVGNHVSPS
jgi:1-acyl-sn-glycerol-3-phosphate acyltransferase